ncbi:VWA domain-containing protein [Xinfangfangia sp. D13-10-4-6]|uniref:VWA domain-containing protein n=1 Tax=Pseudogemmobacter hezensis TaxID=2737662 RepID=UPI00155497BE|nr:VWA domain-containing protein [Pseudogemmobacter hezensis]NPD14642.1 VWA domain-containing protein [Pseudogemmobacter hezensis]
MTDELDKLSAALKNASPAASADARAAALARAMKNFDNIHQTSPQGSTQALRHSKDRQPENPAKAGFFDGVRNMMKFLTTKPALMISTSAAALVVGVMVFLPQNDAPAGSPGAAGNADGPLALSSPETISSRAMAEEAAPAGQPLGKMAHAEIAPEADQGPVVALAAPEPDSEPAAGPETGPEARSAAEPTAVAPAAPAAVENEAAANEAIADYAADYASEAASGEIAYASPPGVEMRARLGTGVVPPIDRAHPAAPEPFSETYANATANPVKLTAEEPVSTFSIDVDTASWSVIRSTLNAGILPAPDQVRIEEMVNYFPYAYAAPEEGEAFATTVSVMPTPWNAGTRLVTIGLQGALPEIANRPPLNLVFLIDTSGSMNDANKLPLLKQSLALMLPELRPEDQVAIVAYAGSAGTVLAPTPAGERDKILAALDSLSAGGGTAGAMGLELAYQLAAQMTGQDEVSRILLATDGDFNVGVSDPDGLEAYIAKKRDQGSYLSVLGFGRGNLNDATMQALAQNGNGTASYIDSLSEARKVLVDQLSGALFPIADDVKVQIEWNPAQVAEYRLIGYETRALAREDFNNDRVDAGEIGAGLQVTAIYEVTAPGSAALRNDPLRYGAAPTAEGATPSENTELGFLRLRWKEPGETLSKLEEVPITGLEPASEETRFAAAIAGFGQLLQGSPYTGEWGYPQAIELALASRGEDIFGYRIEAINLMRLAQSLAR